MPRRHSRSVPSWMPLVGGNAVGESSSHIDRASVLGSAPIIAGTGFVLSRTVAIAVANASALTFLWGLVIGLAFATAGVVVLISTENDERLHRPGARHAERIPFATAGGALLLSLLTGVVLGIVL